MKISFKSTILPALALGAALFAFEAPAQAETRWMTVKEQRDAILDCRHEMRLRGKSVFIAKYPDTPMGGQTYIWIEPGPNLSAADANRINACADARLGRVTDQVFAEEAAPTGICPPGAPAIYGGALYCIGPK